MMQADTRSPAGVTPRRLPRPAREDESRHDRGLEILSRDPAEDEASAKHVQQRFYVSPLACKTRVTCHTLAAAIVGKDRAWANDMGPAVQLRKL